MKHKKIKLLTSIMSLSAVVCLLTGGIYAATTMSSNFNFNVGFTARNVECSLEAYFTQDAGKNKNYYNINGSSSTSEVTNTIQNDTTSLGAWSYGSINAISPENKSFNFKIQNTGTAPFDVLVVGSSSKQITFPSSNIESDLIYWKNNKANKIVAKQKIPANTLYINGVPYASDIAKDASIDLAPGAEITLNPSLHFIPNVDLYASDTTTTVFASAGRVIPSTDYNTWNSKDCKSGSAQVQSLTGTKLSVPGKLIAKQNIPAGYLKIDGTSNSAAISSGQTVTWNSSLEVTAVNVTKAYSVVAEYIGPPPGGGQTQYIYEGHVSWCSENGIPFTISTGIMSSSSFNTQLSKYNSLTTPNPNFTKLTKTAGAYETCKLSTFFNAGYYVTEDLKYSDGTKYASAGEVIYIDRYAEWIGHKYHTANVTFTKAKLDELVKITDQADNDVKIELKTGQEIKNTFNNIAQNDTIEFKISMRIQDPDIAISSSAYYFRIVMYAHTN